MFATSRVPAVLTVTDIAGLMQGASTGAGLGNAFLSHIAAVDGIFHVCRAFPDKEVTHVLGTVCILCCAVLCCAWLHGHCESTIAVFAVLVASV